MKLRHTIVLISLLFFFSQCSEPCGDMACKNNGICVDGVCDCPEGFTGTTCEIDLNQKLKRLTRVGGFILEYEYTLNNKISKQTLYNINSEIELQSEFEVINDTIIETVNDFMSTLTYKNKYYEVSESMIRVETFINNTITISNEKSYMFSEECGLTNQTFIDSLGIPQITVNWIYDDNNCSFTAEYINQYGNIDKRIKGIITSNKLNPIPSVFDHFNKKRIALLDTSYFYNILQDPNAVFTPGTSYSASYEFNSNGFPDKETRKHFNASETTYIYEYL